MLWSSTAGTALLHRALANALQIPPPRARDRLPERRRLRAENATCTTRDRGIEGGDAAGRPVKICLRARKSSTCTGAASVLMKMRTGVTKDGKITRMHTQTLLDGGGYGGYGARAPFTGRASNHTSDRYKFDACGLHQQAACGPKRGHGRRSRVRAGDSARQDRGRTQARSGELAWVWSPSPIAHRDWLKIGTIA